ncbi:restriction endonuclease subunit S [Vibrio fluvialis]|nr:restriction endonuclease subunit S [Vibrio fluvialis]
MGKYQAYQEYKESGIEWITEIPSHWHISNIGHESSVKARLGWKGLKADEYVDEGYVFLATPNIKGKDIDFTDVNRITKDRYDESPEIMLQTGDVLVTKDGSTTGTTNLVRILPEPATVNSSIAVLRSKGAVDSNYLFYFFVSDYTQNVITRMRGGMGVPHLFQADLRKFSILVPPMLEQTQIANFLDHETAKIDTLIEKQQQLIKLLKEKRQAVISHAVTKGLNPQAPMKDSGVEWLGEVPEHWGVVKCGYLGRLFGSETIAETLISDDGDIPFIKVSTLSLDSFDLAEKSFFVASSKVEISKAKSNYIAFPKRGAAIFTNKVNFVRDKSFIDPNLMGWELNEKVMPEYVAYMLKLRGLGDIADVSTVPQINNKHIEPMKFPLPPVQEQKEILETLKGEVSNFNSLEKKAREAIALMQERRTALISAAVTGKIDVRNWQPPTSQNQAMEQTT